jgi:hypothetical protein
MVGGLREVVQACWRDRAGRIRLCRPDIYALAISHKVDHQ